jgi:hypothetical protein
VSKSSLEKKNKKDKKSSGDKNSKKQTSEEVNNNNVKPLSTMPLQVPENRTSASVFTNRSAGGDSAGQESVHSCP